MRKLKPFWKIIMTLGVAVLIAMLIIPFISGLFGEGNNMLQSTGKRVTCDVSIKNPVLTDNFNIERLECNSKETLLCSLPLSISGLSFLRSSDSVTVQLSSANTMPASKAVTVEEGIVSGTITDATISLCIPKENTRIEMRVLDSNNQETDSREVSI